MEEKEGQRADVNSNIIISDLLCHDPHDSYESDIIISDVI
jgi:hypothetical protein